jgi:hypothetical protein
MSGAWVVFIFVVAVSAAILGVLHLTPAGDLHRHSPDTTTSSRFTTFTWAGGTFIISCEASFCC